MKRILDGKRAIVTGGAKGIGLGIAETLLDHGASVALLATAMLSPWLVMAVSAAGAAGIWCVWRLVP